MSYGITPYTYRQARRIGVEVRPSKRADKKIDVFRGGERIASIGHIQYPDYPHYIRSHGKEYANERRRLYHLRHKDGPKNSPTYLAKRLLW
jgi:hypothetical protein